MNLGTMVSSRDNNPLNTDQVADSLVSQSTAAAVMETEHDSIGPASSDSSGSALRAAAQMSRLEEDGRRLATLLRLSAAFVRSVLESLASELQNLECALSTVLDVTLDSSTSDDSALSVMPPLTYDQWCSHADSADDTMEPAAAGSAHAHAADLYSAQDMLQSPEGVFLLHGSSHLSMQISSILRVAALDLETQCVDTTLLLPDDSVRQHGVTVQGEHPKGCRSAVPQKQQIGVFYKLKNMFAAIAKESSLVNACLLFWVVMWIVSFICIYIDRLRSQRSQRRPYY